MASQGEGMLSIKAALSSIRNTAAPLKSSAPSPSKAPMGRLISADQCFTPSRQGMSGVPLTAIIPLQSYPEQAVSSIFAR